MARAVPLTELPVQTILQSNQNLNTSLANAARERMQGREIRAGAMSDLLRTTDRWAGMGMDFLDKSMDRKFTAQRDERQNQTQIQRDRTLQGYRLDELAKRFQLGNEAADQDLQREMWKAEFDATGQTPQQIDQDVAAINAGKMQLPGPDGKPMLGPISRAEYVERRRQIRESEAMQAKERSIQELMTKGEKDLFASYDAEEANIRTSPLTLEEQDIEISKLRGLRARAEEAIWNERGRRTVSKEAWEAAARPQVHLAPVGDGSFVPILNDGQGRNIPVPPTSLVDAQGKPLMLTGAGSRAGSGARGKAGQAQDEIGDTGFGSQTRSRDAYFESVKLFQTDPTYRNGLWERAGKHLDAGYSVNGQVLVKSGESWSAEQVYAAMEEILRLDTDFIERGAVYAESLDTARNADKNKQETNQAGIMERMTKYLQDQAGRIAPVLNAKGNEEAAQRPQRIVAAAIRAAAPGQGTSANAGGLKPFPKGGPPAGGAAPQSQGPMPEPVAATPRKEAPVAAPSVAESRKGKKQPEWMQRALPAPRRVEDMKPTFIYSKVDPASGRVGYYRYTNGKMVKVGEW